jgi:DNA-binding transcriptional LysR family regulator
MSVNSADLRVFETVARLGGIGRAARELATVQSNVTARIRSLETELGKPLFLRHARGVSLTRAGEALLPYAVQVAKLLGDAKRALDDPAPSGALIVGALETTAALRMSPVLIAYRRQFPEVDLSLRTGTTAALVNDVLAYKLEGAFVVGPVGHPELHEEAVFEEELVLISAPSRATLAEALDCDSVLVFREGCMYRSRLEAFLARSPVRQRRVMEFGSLDGILGCVAADLGITVLPRAVANRSPVGALRLHELPRRETRAVVAFVRRQDAFVTRALAEFVRLAQEHARSLRTPRARAVALTRAR